MKNEESNSLAPDEEEGYNLAFDVVSFPLGIVGSLVAVGAITLDFSHATTALIGLVVLLCSRVGLLSLMQSLQGITAGALRVWLFIGLLSGALQTVGGIHALAYLLFH
jgi:hypothetical protein